MISGIALSVLLGVSADPLEVFKGERIAVLGNTLADRMQHTGHLEALLQARFPEHGISLRHMGFAGDELKLRLRSSNFGTPEQWLGKTKASLVLMFFGYNESWAGAAGLEGFKKDLRDVVTGYRAQKFDGNQPPRVVLFSPIAFENHGTSHLPDGAKANGNIALYAKAMGEVAAEVKVPFVDLFQPTKALMEKSATRLTINGIHLNDAGYAALAEIIERELFGGNLQANSARLEEIRKAVLDKDFMWFNRYRTTDGYSIYGGRADLRFVAGQTNRVVMDREMEVLDAMTANRDKVVWAAARGRKESVGDDPAPPFIPVVTNRPGALDGGKHLFLPGEKAIEKIKIGNGLKVNLFASEETWPELANPVQMAWDAKGRLWVAVWPTYPHWKPKEPMNDKILVLEDTNGDGKADKMSVFADGLHNPTGFEFANGGVLVAQAPDLVFLKDSDGDGKADVRQRVIHGIDSADTHHTANSFATDPGGAIYFQEGTFHHTQVETPFGAPWRCANGGVFRYEPRSQKFEVYVTYGFANPHGHVFDKWGQDIVVDGTGAVPYHGTLFSGFIPFPAKHSRPPTVYQQRTRPCPGMEYVSSEHFPEEFQGNLLVANVIGFQGILRYKVFDKDASFGAEELEPILSSTDPNFRPSDLKFGPDGALYFIDWHNPIIGHMQHNLRDPSRDREHGRIYRVTHEGRPVQKAPVISGASLDQLVAVLDHPVDRFRALARMELAGRPAAEVEKALRAWASAKPAGDRRHLEALWVMQHLDEPRADWLKAVLSSPDFRARAAAVRVLCAWRDRIPDVVALLKVLAADEHPRVRLEAVRAASWVNRAEAVEVPIIAGSRGSDTYIDFVRGETMRTLDPLYKDALARGEKVEFSSEAAKRYLLRSLSVEALLKQPRTPVTLREILLRPGVRDEARRSALADLAREEKRGELRALLELVGGSGSAAEPRDEAVLVELVRLIPGRPASELAAARADIEALARSARQPILRQVGYVMLLTVDGQVDKVWELASKSVAGLRDLAGAVPMIADPSLRSAIYPRLVPLLDGLPAGLDSKAARQVNGRFVRVELPGRQRTLTLAEVEVLSDGVNLARKGAARQSSTTNGAEAKRAIDGNTAGDFGSGTQTHTQEGTTNPWWEVDLGGEFPIDSVVVHNRTDGNLGNRLSNHTIKVLDAARKTVFEKTGLPAPATNARVDVGGESPDRALRAETMLAMVSVRGQEEKTFAVLAGRVKADKDRLQAVRALARLPRNAWSKAEAPALADIALGVIKSIPAKDRTGPAAIDYVEFADGLSALLPDDRARSLRKELGDLAVRVIRLGTLPERMAYDKELIVAQAGKPIEIVLTNDDFMPHNFVITSPGALEEVGALAEASAASPEFQARQFVPKSAKVLLSSRLLQTRESQQLAFTAPATPGVYPYVCTYPGHWRRMYGALYVVADLDAYQANPEAYLAKNPMTAADALLKDRRPRTEWKLDDLATAVEHLEPGRSYNSGRQMFTMASCISCHKVGDQGNDFGPKLAELDPKWKPVDVLREILEPSHRIHEKFRSQVIELKNGKTITGLVTGEKDGSLLVVENPLAKAEATKVPKAEVESRAESKVSLMPKGLLDKLTRDEVIDLLSFVFAKGDPKHPLFQKGGHGHGHGH